MSAITTTLRRSAVTVDQGIARFEMRDPASRNAFTHELKQDFADLVSLMRGDAAIRVLVLSGSDGAFCSGGDLKSLTGRRAADGSMIRDIEGIRLRMRDSHAWFEALFNLDQPVIAAIDGPAFGAGFSLALAADFIVATPRASFCMAFNRIGALPDLAALYMLPRMIGLRRAKDIMMTARVVGVDEALALGIVYAVKPADTLQADVMTMAHNLAQGSAQALAMTKLYSNQSLESDYATMARLEGVGQATCLNSDYFFDAVSRFVERKPAKYTWNR